MVLWNRQCGSLDDMNVTFEDGAPSVVCSSQSSAVGTTTSSEALSLFQGTNTSGPWSLQIEDKEAGDPGYVGQMEAHFML